MKKIINSKFVLFILLAIFSACVSGSKMKNKHYQQWGDVSENKEENEKTESTIVYIETNNSFETEILNESISIHTIVSAENSDFNQNQSIHSKSSTNKKVTDEDFSLSDLKFKKQLKSSLFPSPLPANSRFKPTLDCNHYPISALGIGAYLWKFWRINLLAFSYCPDFIDIVVIKNNLKTNYETNNLFRDLDGSFKC